MVTARTVCGNELAAAALQRELARWHNRVWWRLTAAVERYCTLRGEKLAELANADPQTFFLGHTKARVPTC